MPAVFTFAGNMPYLALLCGLWQSGNVRSNTAGTGMYGFGRDVPCRFRSVINGFVVRFVRDYRRKTAGAEKYRSCRKYDVLQFRFIYQSVANRLCIIVSAPSDLSKAVLFIQLFCRLVITADFKKNAFYAVIFAFIYKIFH